MTGAESRRRRLVVVASGVSWDGVKGSERQLAQALTAHAEILWADPPVSPVTAARFRGVAVTGRHWRPTLTEVADGITRLTPLAPPGLSRPGIREVTWPAARAQLRWAVRRLGKRPHAVISCSVNDVLGHWPPGVVQVLYGTDDWVAGAELMGLDPRRVVQDERKALGHANLVLAVGPELAERWRSLGVTAREFPNGCEPEAYEGLESEPPAELPAGFPTPVAGLSGQLSERIDLAFLEAVADTGLGLVLVGPRDPAWQPERVDALLRRDNVHYAGALPFERLRPWLARFDVGLTPYADTAFNRASFPLKTLEYLAAGKPVVSTDLPASRRLRAETAEIRLASTPRDFAAAVREAVRQKGDPAARREVARRHSWRTRADELAEMLGLSRHVQQSPPFSRLSQREIPPEGER
ncbi:teichuronic acid biosynthesis glycosyltransferase TuaH [Amycolatopsis bartoniae]|uniref:Glycosyl transferase n=1 Tax=Amycolatopsis bartoniae TaxID=941986 RepID=A0A8H9J449_9PSEU|nr:glycosyltransferase [Amycolatopsis bartoniae]MBB2933730.1 teichuronic acid biosynthesis glycosyltransferase TuaH [Amycolatopsis bartoniae]TVT10601.1 glycosyltransferase family 1 protein [Amycolatopsis bartoniae]GHF72026.1 glycosyl transferase [Amycolatopsis bartoniae]